MISLNQVRSYMKKQAEEDKKVKSIQLEGDSIETVLKQAAIELGSSVKNLEYEVLKKGAAGSFGIAKKNWVLRIYKKLKEVAAQEFEEDFTEGLDLDSIAIDENEVNRNGEVFVKLIPEGVFLKVTKPINKGLRVTDKMALDSIRKRHVVDFSAALVAKVVKRADDQYVNIGKFDYNPANDAIMSVDISDMEMKAFMSVRAPGIGGSDLTYENILAILKNNGIIFGIKEDIIRQHEEYPEFNSHVLVAEGEKAANGSDAKIIYNFKIDHSNIVLKEKDGKVDFKDLNIVENVVAGQFLAKKIPHEEGKQGQTVTGKMLPAKSGKDVEIDIGKNVRLSEDGKTAISEINGQVLVVSKKINVEPIYTVAGDVNLHTGNILFLGTVIVKGNVDDGFSVKASGNVEVIGNVGKCEIDAEGDVVVHQGILGKTGGKVRSGGNVIAKFIEHAHIQSVGNVIVSEGIIHSTVDSNKKIICQGRRASIVGGRLRAAEEINAKNFGSVAGSETILEVGYDPQSKEQLIILEEKNGELMKVIEGVELNIKTLQNLKKVQRKLPKEKAIYLEELLEKRSEYLTEVDEINTDIKKIKERLTSIKKEGKISASDKVFPGVKIFIKDVNLDVRNEFKSVTFVMEHGNITTTKYEAVDEELRRRK